MKSQKSLSLVNPETSVLLSDYDGKLEAKKEIASGYRKELEALEPLLNAEVDTSNQLMVAGAEAVKTKAETAEANYARCQAEVVQLNAHIGCVQLANSPLLNVIGLMIAEHLKKCSGVKTDGKSVNRVTIEYKWIPPSDEVNGVCYSTQVVAYGEQATPPKPEKESGERGSGGVAIPWEGNDGKFYHPADVRAWVSMVETKSPKSGTLDASAHSRWLAEEVSSGNSTLIANFRERRDLKGEKAVKRGVAVD